MQTNFKLFAYSRSPLYLAILGLFTNLEMRLPDVVVGSLTHKSVRTALLRGIRAKDIAGFLEARAMEVKGGAAAVD